MELLAIPKSAVSLKKRVMIGGSKKEAGKGREIPLHHKILSYISYFMSLPGDLLITTPSGEPINYNTFLKHRFYPLLDRLHIPYKEGGKNILTPHRSRHTFVSKSVAAGVQKEVLKEVVGHAKYSTTVEKYGDNLDLDLKVRNIDKIV